VKALSAGSEIDAWCTSCRMDLGHRIVAMVGGTPKRVQCLTCNKQHNYRAPRSESERVPSKKRATARTTRTSTPRAGAVEREWRQAISSRSDDIAVPYSMASEYEPGQLLSHPKFGDGVVQDTSAPKKAVVLFEGGPRTLIHGRT